MAYYIALPLKKTSEVDLVKPLKNLIAQEYSPCVAEVYPDVLNKLNELRKNSTLRTLDKHESSLEEMCKYYDQLGALESRFKSKFPPSDFQIPFEWKDAFETGTPTLKIPSLAYEKVCILFNIAAMQSQIAARQGADVHTKESLKSAAKYFQLSSGIFDCLRKRMMLSVIQQDPTPDLQPDTLSALQILMLAQAQETIFHKVEVDELKNDIIAKIASQCEEYYAEALKQMEKESTRMLWEKGWINVVGVKQAQFKAVAEYYQSLVCKEENKIGEELARLQTANREFCKEKDAVASQREAILRDLAAAHDAYMELCSDLKERKKFYNDLTEILINFQGKISADTPTPSTSSLPSPLAYVPPSASTSGIAYTLQAQPVQASSMGAAHPPYQNVQYNSPPPPYTPYAGQLPVLPVYPPAPNQQTYIHPNPGYPQQQQQPGAYQFPQ